jgi:hypothetical protein
MNFEIELEKKAIKLNKQLESKQSIINETISSIEEAMVFNIIIELKYQFTKNNIYEKNKLTSVKDKIYNLDLTMLMETNEAYYIANAGNLDIGIKCFSLENIIETAWNNISLQTLLQLNLELEETDIEVVTDLSNEYKKLQISLNELQGAVLFNVGKFSIKHIIEFDIERILKEIQFNFEYLTDIEDEGYIKIMGNHNLDDYDSLEDLSGLEDFPEEIENKNLLSEGYSPEYSIEKQQNMLQLQNNLSVNINPQIKEFIDLITKTNTKKIITILDKENSENIAYDISKIGYVGYNVLHKGRFIHALTNMLDSDQENIVIVREFLPFNYLKVLKSGKKVNVPYKNVYGYIFNNYGIYAVPEEDLKDSYSIDAETGKTIELEEGVTYSCNTL